MSKKCLSAVLGFCLVCLILVPTAANADPAKWPQKVRFGLMPNEGGGDVIDRFKPLINHLQSVLGIEVEAISASDYAGIITGMAHKHLEFAYLGPKSYVEAAVRANAQAVALETVEIGVKGYYGTILSKKGSRIKTIEQAKGRVFAFTEPNSTSGYLVPMVLFKRDLKVEPEQYFSKVQFSGSHDASILGLKNGTIDVAATNDLMLNRAAEKGLVSLDDFNVIWKGDLIPGSPICVRSDLPESFKAALCGALMMFNSNKMGLQKIQIAGYVPCDDSTYDTIRYLKKIKAELKRVK